MCPLEGTQEKLMQPYPKGQYGYMDKFGMPHLGQLRMENTKPIIGTKHLWLNTTISKLLVVLPTLRFHVIWF